MPPSDEPQLGDAVLLLPAQPSAAAIARRFIAGHVADMDGPVRDDALQGRCSAVVPRADASAEDHHLAFHRASLTSGCLAADDPGPERCPLRAYRQGGTSPRGRRQR